MGPQEHNSKCRKAILRDPPALVGDIHDVKALVAEEKTMCRVVIDRIGVRSAMTQLLGQFQHQSTVFFSIPMKVEGSQDTTHLGLGAIGPKSGLDTLPSGGAEGSRNPHFAGNPEGHRHKYESSRLQD